ncbi:MAG: hypothetical protein HOL66_15985 [Rhodospirillaceae bacterium]|jgi:hypothetical protein|nr:hypothetical protein [Rhodospirillaceae bacterium]MBT5245734.1 hypothetical protein [Rhodospirillaceae bacterium]MBT5561476.1 hypothetical protein [Rhodospirillaceae bacterium]MBT7138244.1 hypothetical protein [Rhodospirillaceae bacterium]
MAISPQENGAGDQSAGGTGPVLINDQFLVDVNTPISELDMPSAKAYAVRDRRNQEIELFALIATPGMPTRMDVLQKLNNESHHGLMTAVAWDTAFWPPINQHTSIIIYERPLGGSVALAIERGEFKANEYEIQDTFIEPIYKAIKDMELKEINHREIRVENLFFMDKGRTEVVLGDCVTCPPGFDQPLIYEPIERGMASPGGRGSGSLSDDLYAMGVTIVSLILGKNIIEHKTPDDLFKEKIEHGSYSALCGKRRIPVTVIEPLRGVLSDDPGDRWGVEEMNLWMEGKRQTPMQRKPALKSETPYIFMEIEYRNAKSLAHSFTQNVKEGAAAIKDEKLETWLRRNLEEGDLADSINAIAAAAELHENTFRGMDDYVVTKASILMDPEGPIRYKGLAFMPEGYGPALAVELLRRNSMQTAAEVINHGITEIWYSAPCEKIRDEASIEFQSVFARLKTILQIEGPGFGIERCLYDLNASLACQSPLIAELGIINIEDLLPALDDIADRTDKKLRPLDRHVTAFIAARFKERIEPHLSALAEPKDSSFMIGLLSLLAYLQWKLKAEPVYALTSWIGSLLGPAINTYFSRSTRHDIEQEMPRVVRQGSLPELFDLIDNAEKRRQDMFKYDEARFEYSTAEEEIQEIEAGELSSPEAAQEVGQKYASITSIVLTMIFISIMVLGEFW